MDLQKQSNIWHELPRPFYVLAPMEDVTDTVFRRLIFECGAPDLFFSEFTSTDGLVSKVGFSKVSHRLLFEAQEKPIIAQIWGNNPNNYYIAAKHIAELGFDGIDINMGCPVEKVIKAGSCSALIENPQLAKELYLAAVEGAGGLPVSIKTRIGFRTKQVERWGEDILSLNPAAVTVHGRTAKQLSLGQADWASIKRFVELRNQISPQTVMVGNGDVITLTEGENRTLESGVDGVMIGRGIFENLYLFDRNAVPLKERSTRDKLNLLLKHAEMFTSTWQETKPYRVLKKYFKIYIVNFKGASALRSAAVETESYEELKELIENHNIEEES